MINDGGESMLLLYAYSINDPLDGTLLVSPRTAVQKHVCPDFMFAI